MPTDVFLSYSTKDAAITQKICAAIEARGVRCWMAPRDVLPGTSYAQSIVEAIKNSSVMVVVFSTNSNQSEQVQREVERGGSQPGMTLIPVRIENIRPSGHMEYFLSSQHWLDAFEPPLPPHLDRLAQTVVATLARKRGEKPPATPTPTPTPLAPPTPAKVPATGPKTLPLLVAGGSAVLVLLLALAYLVVHNSNKSELSKELPPSPLAELAKLVSGEDWKAARIEVDRLQFDPQVPKNSEYRELVRKVEEEEKLRLSEGLSQTLQDIDKSIQELGEQVSDENMRRASKLLDDLHRINPKDISKANPSIATSRAELESKLESKLSYWKARSAYDKALRALAPTGGIEALATSLTNFCAKYPNEISDSSIVLVAKESAIWPGIDAWNIYLTRREFYDKASLTPDVAGKLIEAAGGLSDRYPIKTFESAYNERNDHLQHVSQRRHSLSSSKDRVQIMLDGWTSNADYLSDVYLLDTKRGKYYTLEDYLKNGKATSNFLTFRYIIGSQKATHEDRVPMGDVVSSVTAPHCDVIVRLVNCFNDIRTKGWVPAFSKALQMLKTQADGIDPILHVLLFQKVSSNGATGSVAIDQAFSNVKEALKPKIEEDTKWFLPTGGKSPERVKIEGQRSVAKRILDSIPDLNDAAREAAEIEQRLYAPTKCSFDYAGWLKRSGSDWTIADMPGSGLTGEIFVVTKRPGAEKAEMIQVGSLKSGAPSWNREAQEYLLEWRPLFLKK